MVSRHAIDPNATVYYERGDYARIVERIAKADQVDLLGISLMYVLEYLKDHPGEYAHRVRYTRILLPATREICDSRDAAQGTQVGALWSAVTGSHRLLERIVTEYRASFAVRFFTIQPYLAITRVDDHMWASPYLTVSGRSSPVIAVTRDRSPELYRAFTAHYNTLWRLSLPEPQQ